MAMTFSGTKFLALALLLVLGAGCQLKTANHVPVGYQTYSSKTLGVSFVYPAAWYLDRSQEANHELVVLSQKDATLSEMNTTGAVAFNTIGKNPKRLGPEAWFRATILSNIDPPKNMHTRDVGSYHAYAVTVTELQENIHVYMFKGKRVVEVTYPTGQPQFTDIYQKVLSSISIQ